MTLNKEYLELKGLLSLIEPTDYFNLHCNNIKYKFTFEDDFIVMHNTSYTNITLKYNAFEFFKDRNYDTRINILKKVFKNRQRSKERTKSLGNKI